MQQNSSKQDPDVDNSALDMDKHPGGRPQKELKWDVMDAILAVGGLMQDCVEILGLSRDTIERRVKEVKFCTFSEYRNQKMAYRRIKLLNKQWEVANAGNVVMLIWLGKQWCGQSDKIADVVSDESSNTVKLKYNIPGNKYIDDNGNRKKPDIEVIEDEE